jgi:hypothetical protein
MTPTKETLILISRLFALFAVLGTAVACGSTDSTDGVTGNSDQAAAPGTAALARLEVAQAARTYQERAQPVIRRMGLTDTSRRTTLAADQTIALSCIRHRLARCGRRARGNSASPS